ncbi:MAG: Rieske 2Fe-2S domain-containing protein [Nitrospinaceae bacterium]|nr:Rieske 2Fe-2S domain-containing protein [Nitrospinaceae bacterium]
MEEEELPPGKSAIISAGDEEIALFNYKGKYFAIANKCLHKGSPLGEGRIEEGVVICPNHEWRYNLETGYCTQNPFMKTKVFPVRVHKGKIRIGLEIEEKGKARKATGKQENKPPESLKFKIPVIQKPINPDETL